MAARIVRAERRGPALLPAVHADARLEARAIVERAHAAASAIAERARAEGREQGRAELAGAFIDLSRAREAALAELAHETKQAALLAAQHLLAAELALAPERISAVVAPLLERVRRARRVVLHAHPDDCDALRALLADAAHAHVELLANPELTRGGCVVVSDIGTLDARVETRLDRLREALERA